MLKMRRFKNVTDVMYRTERTAFWVRTTFGLIWLFSSVICYVMIKMQCAP